MLQTRFVSPQGAELSSSDSLSLHHAVSFAKTLILRQYPLMLFIVLIGICLGAAYVLTAPKKYTSTASLIIDTRKIQALQQQGSLGGEATIDSPMVDSQVEILKSENIARSVIKDLRLMDSPEFVGGEGGLISALLNLLPNFSSGEDNAAPSNDQVMRGAIATFIGKLDIKRVGQSYVIQISFTSLSPVDAARIANAVAEGYIVDSLESKYQASRRAAVWLQDRMKELRAQASAAERAVADFKAKNNIVDAGGRLLSDQQLAEINSSLTQARAQTAEAEARLGRITSILDTDDRSDASVNSKFIDNLATVTDTLNNPVIVKLRQNYLEIAARASDWTNRYGAQHLAVVNLRNQMLEIRRSIADELRRIAETYKSDLAIAKAREDSIQKSLTDTIAISNDTSQAQIVLRDLESNAQSARALADNFLQLYMVSVQQQSFPITEARVITEASPPLGPSAPKTSLILFASIVGGSILAGLAGFLRDAMDRVFRTRPQVEELLGINCLAAVPLVSAQDHGSGKAAVGKRPRFARWAIGHARNKIEASGLLPARRNGNPSQSQKDRQLSSTEIANVVIASPFSRFTEAIRSIKMAADLNGLDTERKVLGITSSLPNEGKSTVSEALARVTAQGGARTLLVDGDLRNPSLTGRLAPEAKAGLIELAFGKATLNDVIWSDASANFHFLPCVASSRLPNSSDLLASTPMEKLFREFRDRYDRIILDLSPLAPVIDVRGTGRLADSYVLVIEWARAKIDVVERALNDSHLIKPRLLGAVLNKVDIAVMSRYDSHRGDYYNNRYYERYGYLD